MRIRGKIGLTIRTSYCKNGYIILLLCCILSSCSTRVQNNPASIQGHQTDSLIENILRQNPSAFSHLLNNRDSFRIQIIYTRIDRTRRNRPVFHHHYFNVNAHDYFYPASTVKLPVAVLALQRLRELKKFGVDVNTSMITEAANDAQTPVYNDPESPDGRPTVGQYIRKIFLVSDNDAFNRLYELLGPDYIHDQLQLKGFTQSLILHRLSVSLTEQQNRETNPVRFLDDSLNLLYEKPYTVSHASYQPEKKLAGKGFIAGNQLINQPFDFTFKNSLPIAELHGMMQQIMFPKSVSKKQRFSLEKKDYKFLRKYMSQYPRETAYPPYSDLSIPDGNGKFFYWGDEKQTLPEHLRIFNKVGGAYGFLTDASFVVDFDNSVEFLLTATIYCNKDEILNDDLYDYDSVGLPFMKNLGRAIYEHELQRPKKRNAKLTVFRIEYDQ